MRNSWKVIVFLSPVISCFQGMTQKFELALNELATRFPQEKIYIHYDKEYYVAGETIWFKAYLYKNGSPSGISNNFYLQFADQMGRIILQKKYPVMGAVAKGNILIPDSLSAGDYYVRALTPGMLNYDEAFIYKKNIFIFKPPASTIRKNDPATKNVSLQFFPESGNLVNGLAAVVGFKAVDQWGLPVEVSGLIRSDDGTVVTSFKSYHDGIGKMEYIPLKGKKCSAEIEINGTKKTFPLPEIQTTGITLKVQDEAGGKLFQLARTEIGKEEFEPVHLVVEMNNVVVYENEIAFEGYPSVQGHLLTDSLPSGILHFTVFNKNNMPLAERLSFVNNREYITNATLDFTKPGMEKRAENIIELSFPEALQRSCSVSITDASGGSLDNQDNIYSTFLLTGDLKGYIHNPAWYFIPTDSSRQGIDNLLLTQGWRRFHWTKILNNEFPVIKYIDEGPDHFDGFCEGWEDNKLLTDGKLNIYLQGEDSSTQNHEVTVDGQGRFTLKSLSFRGRSKLYYAYSDIDGKQKPAKIHLEENEMEKLIGGIAFNSTEYNAPTRFVVAQENDEINQRYQNVKRGLDEVKELEKVVLKSKTTKKSIDIVNDKYTTGVFRSMGKVNIDNINEPANDRSMNAVDFIKNRIQQVELSGNTFVNRKNFSLVSGKKWIVEVFLNESPSDLSMIRTIRADEIAMVKFYEAGFVGVGSGAPGGAIVIYTKQNSPEDVKIDKLEYAVTNGYAITKEFYHPDYNTGESKKDFSDNRTTLYWNPDVYTDTESKSFKLNFFNNDFTKKFRVVVEGFDAAGKLIHLEKITGN